MQTLESCQRNNYIPNSEPAADSEDCSAVKPGCNAGSPAERSGALTVSRKFDQ